MSFFIIEAIQFFIGLCAVIVSYFFIVRHRTPLLDITFRDNEKIRKSFESLSSMGYFMIFIPLILFGINLSQSVPYTTADHLQGIIYFEAGIMFLIGMLHFGVISIFTSKIKI
jgi:hypothetical protein